MIDNRLVINGGNGASVVIFLDRVMHVVVEPREGAEAYATVITEVSRVITVGAYSREEAEELRRTVCGHIGGPSAPIPAPNAILAPVSAGDWKRDWPPKDGKYYAIVGHFGMPYFIKWSTTTGSWNDAQGKQYEWLCYWHNPIPVPA